MEVQLIAKIQNEEKIIAAGSRSTREKVSIERILNKLSLNDAKFFDNFIVNKLGHDSITEFAFYIFSISGVSRVLTHQLVRHRIASYLQMSSREVDLDDIEFTIPKSIIDNDAEKLFLETVNKNKEIYSKLINEYHIPREDARYLIPSGIQTNIVIGMNARTLINFLRLRLCRKAQWEIRELAEKLRAILKEEAPIIFLNAEKPCVADGTIYITSGDNYIHAINNDGSLKWKFDCKDPLFSSPVINENGIIFFGNHGLHALYPNGTEYWNYPTGNTYCDPAIGHDGSIYIGSTNTYFYALFPNGTLKWKYKTGDEIHSHPSIGEDGTIYFGSNDEYFYALFPNGTLKWKYKINGNLYASAAIGNDGTIYCPDHDLYAFNSDGTVKWIFDFGDTLGVTHSSPTISNEGIIYIGVATQGVQGGYIFSINPDGTERWSKKIADYTLASSPSIGEDGTVYIGSSWHESISGNFYGIIYAIGKGNNQPDKPTINGPTSGKIDNSYTYSISSTDEDNDQIYYYIDWGDGSSTGWKGPYNSGQTTSESHIWTSQGSYTIRAKAKDESGDESDWGTLEITMPKGKNFNYAIERFLENHPILYQLLSKITTNKQ